MSARTLAVARYVAADVLRSQLAEALLGTALAGAATVAAWAVHRRQ